MYDKLVGLGMTKLAEDNKKENERITHGEAARMLGGAGATALGGMGLANRARQKGQGLAIKNLEGIYGETSADDINKLLDTSGLRGKITLSDTGGADPSYMPMGDVVTFDSDKFSPSVLAHELGHKMSMDSKKFGKARGLGAGIMAGVGNKVAPLAAGGGIAAHRLNKKRDPKKAKKIRAATLAGTTLPFVPQLAEEARASIKGSKLLDQAGIRDAAGKAGLKGAFGTYASQLAPAAVAGTYFAGDAIRDKLKERKKKKEE